MYNKIINPKTGKYINTNSKLGHKVINKYKNNIGGANKILTYTPTDKYDWVKNMPANIKYKPHYIKDGKCLKIGHKYTPIIKSGSTNLRLTVREQIRLFYDHVFHIRKGLVDKKSNLIEYAYDGKVRCQLFLNKDIENPDKFKIKLDTFNSDIDHTLEDLNNLQADIYLYILDTIDTVETMTDNYQWKKDTHALYAQTNEIESYFNLVKDECQQIIIYLDHLKETTHEFRTNVNHRKDFLFNQSWVSNEHIGLIKMFYEIVSNINNFYENNFEIQNNLATYNMELFLDDNNYADIIDMYTNDLKTIEENDLTMDQVLEL